MTTLIDKWDAIYSQATCDNSVALVLSEHDFLLPKTGIALDLACGLGGNAIFLAQQGLAVTALDISTVAINKLTHYASKHKLIINAYQQQITPDTLKPASFDVIVVSRFLDRTLMNAIIDALKPNGLLFYQTFTREKTTHTPPHNPNYLLEKNELLALLHSLSVVFYQENGLCGQYQHGLRNEAQFIGQKMNNIMIENLDPQHAWNLLQQNPNAVLIDVRTKAEYTDIGHPIGAIHIAWQEQFGSPINPNFIAEVSKIVPDTNTPVLLLCRSGQRSLSAAKALEQVGYSNLINIVNGFEGDPDSNQQRGKLNGWQFCGLPWEQN